MSTLYPLSLALTFASLPLSPSPSSPPPPTSYQALGRERAASFIIAAALHITLGIASAINKVIRIHFCLPVFHYHCYYHTAHSNDLHLYSAQRRKRGISIPHKRHSPHL
mmetsp:Transcript_29420/g.75870  ORF Transcript_29420/g.75870 Transcript_29420/m.75870 type:complete len:109 (-) Transcript_29420:279-605(-)